MKNSKPEIRVGARGWDFEQWYSEYYPDDLPEDWRFSFYSNDFQAVMIPVDYLSQFTPDDWQEWVEDTSKEFWFYVEISASSRWEEVEPYLKIFSDNLKGVVVSIKELDSVDSLSVLINKVKHICPVTIRQVGDNISEQDMETLQSCHEVNECWDGRSSAPNWSYNESAAILLRDNNDDNSPEIMRQLMEKGIEHVGRRDSIALFFAGTSPKIGDLQTARTITDLLV